MIKVSALLLVFIPLFAQANLCRMLTEDSALTREKLSQDLAPQTSGQVTAQWTEMVALRERTLQLYDQVVQQTRTAPVLSEWQTLSVLANPEMAYYHKRLNMVLESALADGTQKTMNQKILSAVKKSLRNAVPKDTIEKRIEALVNNERGSLLQALGEMNLSEVQRLVYGKNPLRPSNDSLLGQYIKATGAATRVRTFTRGPRRMDGPKKLVVSLSPQSFEKYNELFSLVNFLIHMHSPQQGTLQLVHEGMWGSYGRNTSAMRAPGMGALLPHVLLTTSEGQRARLFFELAKSGAGEAREPWQLENYCATGGYASCTHWFGNIPVGDKLVKEYTFPGKVDQYANNSVGPGPQTKVLKPFEHANPLASLVWKAPGHQQLSDVIGLHRANISGELANPGWVAYSLLGGAGVDRVPFVFLATTDHRSPIPKNFDLQISAY
jgi:hypothetical protein